MHVDLPKHGGTVASVAIAYAALLVSAAKKRRRSIDSRPKRDPGSISSVSTSDSSYSTDSCHSNTRPSKETGEFLEHKRCRATRPLKHHRRTIGEGHLLGFQESSEPRARCTTAAEETSCCSSAATKEFDYSANAGESSDASQESACAVSSSSVRMADNFRPSLSARAAEDALFLLLPVCLLLVLAGIAAHHGNWQELALAIIASALLALSSLQFPLAAWHNAKLSPPLLATKQAEASAAAAAVPASHPVHAAATHEVARPAAPIPDPRLTGAWIKIPERSDSQNAAIELLRLNGMIKAAVCLYKGVNIRLHDGTIQLTGTTHVPLVKVAPERYPLSGEPVYYPRRDMRKGKHEGRARVEGDGSVVLTFRWGAPLPGESSDELRLAGTDELHVTTTLRVSGRSCLYTVVYRRASGHKEK